MSEPRVRQLDVLRAIAVLLVLGHHMDPPDPGVVTSLRVVVETWHRAGWVGVDLFFVLSGFLVSGLLFTEWQRHGRMSALRFLVRRAFKIYPPFYLLLLSTALLVWRAGNLSGDYVRGLVAEAAYVQNYREGVWSHTWSLAIEEHFYLLLPLLLLLLLRWHSRGTDPFRGLVLIVPAWGAIALALRCVAALSAPHPQYRHFVATHLRIDSLLWGVLLSYGFHFRRSECGRWLRERGTLVLLLVPLLLAPSVIWDREQSRVVTTIGLTTSALGFAGILAFALFEVRTTTSRWATSAANVLGRIGFRSYSIYLWHMPIVLWVIHPLARANAFAVGSPTLDYALKLAVYLTSALALGFLTAWLVERPALAVRDRLVPSRSRLFPARFVLTSAAPVRDVVPAG